MVADVAEGDHPVVLGLVLEVEAPVHGVGKAVVGVVAAEDVGGCAVGCLGKVGELLGEDCGVAGGAGGRGAEGVGQGGTGGRGDRHGEGQLHGDAEGAAEAASGTGREVGEEFTAVEVEAETSADGQMLDESGAPGDAEFGAEAVLALLQGGVGGAGGGVLRIARENQAAVGDGVGGGVVGVEVGVEVDERAVLFGHGPFVVPAQTEVERQVALHLVVVLDVGADLVGAVVAVGGTVVEGAAGRVFGAGQEGGEVGEGDGCRLGAVVDHVQLGVVPGNAIGQSVAAEDLVGGAAHIPLVLVHADVGEVAAGAEAEGLVQGIVDGSHVDLREQGDAPEIDAQVTRGKRLLGLGIGAHADETGLVFPGQIGGHDGGVVDGSQLGTRVEGLAETVDGGAAAVGVVVGRILGEVLDGEAFALAPVVIDAAGGDIGLGGTGGACDGHVVAKLLGGNGVFDGWAGDEIGPVDLGRHDLEGGGIDLALCHGHTEVLLGDGGEGTGAAVVTEVLGNGGVLGSGEVVTDAQRLVGAEEEQLVLDDRAAHGGTGTVVVQWRHFLAGRDGGVGVAEELGCVEGAVLEVLVDLAVQAVGPGFRDQGDVGAGLGALGRIVHGGVHANFLEGFLRRRGEGLADTVVDRRIGADLAGHGIALAGVEGEPAGSDLAARLAVEDVVGVDAVHDKAVGGIALSVGPYGLVAESGVGTGASEEVGIDAWGQEGQLGEASRTEGRLADGALIEHVAVGGIGFVEERRTGDFDRRGDRAHLESRVDGGGAFGLDEDLGVDFGGEAGLLDGDGIQADREVRNLVEAVGLGFGGQLEVGGVALDRDGCVCDGCAAGIGNVAEDGSQ